MRILRIAVLAVLLALFGNAALAQGGEEKILNFRSSIRVHEDASLSVSESITINCTGDRIKRGIYRDFPTKYQGRYGEWYNVDFEVMSVQMDGSAVPYVVQQRSNGVRVRIGEEDVFVRPGTHTYSISYRTAWQLGYFDEHDELYWNVTGNGWEFSIEKAEAVVTLPESIRADDIKLDAYTGPQGAKDKDFTASVDHSGRSVFTTTRKLFPSYGMTIVVGWPKGFVHEPTPAERRQRFLDNNGGLLTGAVGLLAVLFYYLLAWAMFGKDPAKKTVVPTWEPPNGLSPAQMRCLVSQRCDSKALAAAITSAAVKGRLKIAEGSYGDYVLKLRGEGDSGLSEDERFLVACLFEDSKQVVLSQGNYLLMRETTKAFRRQVENELKGRYYVSNSLYFKLGIALSIAVLLASSPTSMVTAAVVLPLVVVNYVFHRLLSCYTAAGMELYSRVMGFKMYLSVAERESLQNRGEPDKTPELYEKFLPYAIALGVEREWTGKFTRVLESAASSGGDYRPEWYSGTSWSSTGYAASAASYSSAFARAIAVASVPPGSDSGFSGGSGSFGGSSGGGGGGGGGGGW